MVKCDFLCIVKTILKGKLKSQTLLFFFGKLFFCSKSLTIFEITISFNVMYKKLIPFLIYPLHIFKFPTAISIKHKDVRILFFESSCIASSWSLLLAPLTQRSVHHIRHLTLLFLKSLSKSYLYDCETY